MSRGRAHLRQRSSTLPLRVFVASLVLVTAAALALIVTLHVMYPGR